jgi:RNA polymerase sigma-70 factor (ECF subfamily)
MTDFTPYLLQQATLRASLLQRSFGFGMDDWDDLRQDLALDCLRRLPRFDESRGDWRGFIRGVVRHHACVLASRQVRRWQFQPIADDSNTELQDGSMGSDELVAPGADFRPALELGMDAERVLAGLPEDLRHLAEYLSAMPIAAVRRETGLTLAQLNRRIRQIRAAFLAAGLAPARRSEGRL